MDLFEIWTRIRKAGVEIYNLPVSKHDLKRSLKKWKFWFCSLGLLVLRLSYEAYKVTQNINTECQTEEYKVIFLDRFKSCFDTGSS